MQNDSELADEGLFSVGGSYGRLLVCATTGFVRRYIPEEGCQEYADIDRFNIEEYVEYNGALDDTDILLIGYWRKNGRYEPPTDYRSEVVAAWRMEETDNPREIVPLGCVPVSHFVVVDANR